MDGRPAEEAQGAAVGAGGGQAVQVADVGVDRLGRRGEAGRAGGDDDPGAGPVEARVVPYPQVGPEVGLAEGDAAQGGVGGGDGVGVLDAEGRSPAGRGAADARCASARDGRADVCGVAVTFGRRRPREAGEGGQGLGRRCRGPSRALTRTWTGTGWGSVRSSAVAARAYSLRSGATASSRSTMTTSAPRGQGLGDHVGAVAGDVQPGQREAASQGALRRAGRRCRPGSGRVR